MGQAPARRAPGWGLTTATSKVLPRADQDGDGLNDLERGAEPAQPFTPSRRCRRSFRLVIPTRHVPTILELRAVEGHGVVDLVRRAATVIDRVEQRPGISVWQNNGVDAHQAIPHVHFHVAGTVDGGSTERGEVTEQSVSETEAIASRLRPFF